MQRATHYIVQHASAHMPNFIGRSNYRRVAVLEVDVDREGVSMISERARGCHLIGETWERLYDGKTDRCAFAVALAAAEELASELNA